MLARPSSHNAKSVNHRFSRGAALFLGVIAVATLPGCGHGSPGSAISIPRLEHELTALEYREKLAQGYTFGISTRCDPSSGDLLHFVCAVTATGGTEPFTFNVAVTCFPPGAVQGARCVSDSGDALD